MHWIGEKEEVEFLFVFALNELVKFTANISSSHSDDDEKFAMFIVGI